jgi:hypothetical protein
MQRRRGAKLGRATATIPCAGAAGPLISVNNPWRQVELRYQRQRAIWCFYGYGSL